jgi:hypothetical protein
VIALIAGARPIQTTAIPWHIVAAHGKNITALSGQSSTDLT